ncbi:Indole-3-acetaldehyde oxidase [Capsicum baccatum]|uniref:Indole-3-acetaldehyde oxidase n=1 Tax=Capsicum baccatum TaxID=33114 RepID=A0A2G2VPI3_CAPBA|nr:Indole-3-acetaldehyde oxidase [Capsicum baccatum]
MTASALGLIESSWTKDLMKNVRVTQEDSLSLVQGAYTGGSTTSESNCEAVRLCCDVLVERLTPLKKQLQEQNGSVDWPMLISQAQLQSVNLAENSYYVPKSSSSSYLNFGAAVSEVKIDILTGETTILQSDIIYDCGKSLNPAVDMGQFFPFNVDFRSCNSNLLLQFTDASCFYAVIIEGAFVQGIGFFMQEEYLMNEDSLMVSNSTWTYKIPTLDTIPQNFNVHVVNSGHHKKRVLSSKGDHLSGTSKEYKSSSLGVPTENMMTQGGNISHMSFQLTSHRLNGKNYLEWAQSVKLAIDGNNKIKIADGSFSTIARKVTVKLSPFLTLHDILHVPKLSCNLVSVSKLIRSLNYRAIFDSDDMRILENGLREDD